MALLALDLTGPTASSLRLPPGDVWRGRRCGSTLVSSWRNRTVARVKVQVGPFQPAQLAVAGAGGCGQHGPGRKPWLEIPSGVVKEQVDLVGEQRGGVFVGDWWWGGVLGDVVGEEPPGDRCRGARGG
jgi:hypothetical protein